MSEIIKAGPNTAQYPMHANNLDEVKAWMHGVAAASAQNATVNAYGDFKNGSFAAWFTNYDAGRAEEPPPVVPDGFDAQMSEDGLGFDLISSGAPSGPPPPYKKRVPTPSTGGFGGLGGGTSGRALLIGDIGQILTQQDGTRWVRIS